MYFEFDDTYLGQPVRVCGSQSEGDLTWTVEDYEGNEIDISDGDEYWRLNEWVEEEARNIQWDYECWLEDQKIKY